MSSAAESACGFKTAFDERIKRLELKVNSFCIADRDRYDRIIREVIDAKNRVNRKPLDYRRLKRYEILEVGGRTRLILPPGKCADGGVKYYVHNGELFDVLRASHLDSGHGGLHKMHLNLKRKYVNITRPVIQIFLANCETCSAKRARHLHRVFVGGGGGAAAADDQQRPSTVAAAGGGGARVQFVDMRSCEDGGYRFVMRYTDGGTKFSVLRALETRSADEVARNLIDIFCVFGVPAFVETCDDGAAVAAFTGSLSEKLRYRGTAWARPEVRCGGRESAAETAYSAKLRDFLKAWTADGDAAHWSEALRFCQYRANNTFRADIGRTPFEALFGKRTYRSQYFAGSGRPTDANAENRNEDAANKSSDRDAERTGTVDEDKLSFFRHNFDLISNACDRPAKPDSILSNLHPTANVPDTAVILPDAIAVGLDMRKSSCQKKAPPRLSTTVWGADKCG